MNHEDDVSGLFHAAISQSAAALDIWGTPKNEVQKMVTATQAQLVGCDSNVDSKSLVDCLRRVDAKTLVDSADKFKVKIHGLFK